MGTKEFAEMQVGEQRELPPGLWETNRPIFDSCMEYVKSVDADPRPLFSFDRLPERTSNGSERWVIRRIR